MLTAEIHKRWLDYFEGKGHTIVPSASLVSDDPTLLFTVAGMVPFIPYLTGVIPAPYPRATSVQKCIRTLDIDEVGKTTRHGTFFQMNGNFSFGDYFKEGAIGFAWELLTAPEADGGLGFDEKDLWITVYEEDDEAIDLWKKIAGVPEERIQRFGKTDNFWSTGQPGPAGPCSEIYFDRGARYGPDGGPAADDTRYLEIWNLVFMQYLISNVTSKTEFTIDGELPRKNIDTGMGMERVAFIKQGVDNMYEIDQVRPVLDRASEISGKRYGAGHDDDVRMRVVADHVRSSLMLMSDGVTPSNEGRGYILRRLLRRSVRAMRLLGVDAPTFAELFAVSRDAMKGSYPEVEQHYDRIARTALGEEETFLRTLASGTQILDLAVTQHSADKSTTLAGDTAFLLHDTYGFPIDLTVEMAEEAGLTVDRAVFDSLMREQKDRAKADAKAKRGALADVSVYGQFRTLGETVFTGYSDLSTESTVIGILRDGVSVASAQLGETVELITRETSLYAESGGQDADEGVIVGAHFHAEVVDVQRPIKGLIAHTVRITDGEVAVDDVVTTIVDEVYRRRAAGAHSATHLVHAALRQTLGPDAHQAGSYNKAGYMRFDFAWNQSLSAETRTEIENIANIAISDNLEVVTRVMSLDEARQSGAMALFGEKYGETVRVVDIGGPWSRELCAGTHVTRSSEVGLINLVGESSIGSTNRRIEALVGVHAFESFATERALVAQLTASLKTPRELLPGRIAELLDQLKNAERTIARYRAESVRGRIPELVSGAETVGSFTVVSGTIGSLDSVDSLRQLVTEVRDRVASTASVVAIGAEVDGKASVIVATSASAREAGAKSGELAKRAATILGGGGGGRDDLAQGGGPNIDKITEALSDIRESLGR